VQGWQQVMEMELSFILEPTITIAASIVGSKM
jgi:hypothetical protein